MMNVPNLNYGLLAGKVAVFLGAVGLDLAGHMSPQIAMLASTMLVALGGAHIAQLIGAQAKTAPAQTAADLLQSALDALRSAAPAPANAPLPAKPAQGPAT